MIGLGEAQLIVNQNGEEQLPAAARLRPLRFRSIAHRTLKACRHSLSKVCSVADSHVATQIESTWCRAGGTSQLLHCQIDCKRK
jgi:hypothetical protein